MKMMSILESIVFDEIRQNRADSMRRKFHVPEDTMWMIVYHGTSEKNARNIEKTKLRSGAWASPDRSVAEKYSTIQAHGGKPYVMQLRIFIGSCYPSGDYIVTQEDLYSTTAGFVPKEYVRKVSDIR